jgi:hypothetical protein
MKVRKMSLILALVVLTAGLAAHAAPSASGQKDSRLIKGEQNQSGQEPKAIAPRENMRALNVLVGDWRFDIKVARRDQSARRDEGHYQFQIHPRRELYTGSLRWSNFGFVL